jgi:hypothetical protein
MRKREKRKKKEREREREREKKRKRYLFLRKSPVSFERKDDLTKCYVLPFRISMGSGARF